MKATFVPVALCAARALELISYPEGMAYEKTTKTRLWAPSR
jgi:hypothetical protein